jgi:hypothetical protein
VLLDALLHLVAIHCCGARLVDVRSLDRWLNRFLAASLLFQREDPAEDVAIGNVMTASGNYRVFNGDSNHPDYYALDECGDHRLPQSSTKVESKQVILRIKSRQMISEQAS